MRKKFLRFKPNKAQSFLATTTATSATKSANSSKSSATPVFSPTPPKTIGAFLQLRRSDLFVVGKPKTPQAPSGRHIRTQRGRCHSSGATETKNHLATDMSHLPRFKKSLFIPPFPPFAPVKFLFRIRVNSCKRFVPSVSSVPSCKILTQNSCLFVSIRG
jgi:hypothetical protein